MIHIPIQEILLTSPSQRFAEMKTYQLIRYFQFVLILFAAVIVFLKLFFFFKKAIEYHALLWQIKK